jgi:hypothetical protein
MSSAHGTPVTIDHPVDMIDDLNTFKELAVGVVSSDVRQDADLMKATLFIFNQKVIDDIFGGKLTEISMGYFAKIRRYTGMEPNIDTEQYDIVYNHAALLGQNEGRAGQRVAVKLDSGTNYGQYRFSTKLIA